MKVIGFYISLLACALGTSLFALGLTILLEHTSEFYGVLFAILGDVIQVLGILGMIIASEFPKRSRE